MNPIVKNILAVIIGLVVGNLVNMGLIQAGLTIIPIEGLDPNDMEAYITMMADLEFKHFIFPFLAHALGTLVGAFLITTIAASHQFKLAMGAGAFFLLGGIAASVMFPAPLWFKIVDLVLAYIPMAWLGWKLAGGNRTQPNTQLDDLVDAIASESE